MTPRSITLIGRNHTAPAHMTDAQREQAEGRWHDENGRPWTVGRIVTDMLAMILLFGGLAVLWCVL